MPFTHRISFAGGLFHITSRGNNRDKIFLDERDHEKYRALLRKYREKHEFSLYSYAIMSNHVHLLIEPTTVASISEIMHDLNLSYAKYFNAKYDRTGHVWEGRFHSVIIDSESYLLEVMRYVDLNPVRARMASQPGKYPWTSYHYCAEGKRDDIVDRHEIYMNLGDTHQERQQVYSEYVEGLSGERVGQRGPMFTKSNFLGGEGFEERMVQLYGQQIWPKYRRLLQQMNGIRRGALAQT